MAFVFNAKWVRGECCIDPLRPPDKPGTTGKKKREAKAKSFKTRPVLLRNPKWHELSVYNLPVIVAENVSALC